MTPDALDSVDDDVPRPIALWLLDHPAMNLRQFGPLPPGWTQPVLAALDALTACDAVPVLCKFKLGSLRLRVRPEDLSNPTHAETLQDIIQRAQTACAELCCLCGLPHKRADLDIQGARCADCRDLPR